MNSQEIVAYGNLPRGGGWHWFCSPAGSSYAALRVLKERQYELVTEGDFMHYDEFF